MKPNKVKLPGKGNYALILPGTILYGLDINSDTELDELTKEAESYVPDHVESFVSDTSTIGIIPTFDCNLRCVYCYARGGDSKEVLPLSTATDAIADISKNEKTENLKIDLVGGGEPLLYIDLVRDIVIYAKKLFKKVEIHVVSNSTFDKETLDWIIANNVLVRSSFDGVMHQVQRPFANQQSSRDIVVDNIARLIEADVELMVQCIVTSDGVKTLRKTLLELVKLGVKTIKFEAARSTDVSRQENWKEPDPVEFANALLDVIQYAAELNRDIKIDTGYFSVPENTSYCGVSGQNRILTPIGLITSCLEVSRPTDPYSEKIIYGKISDGKIVMDIKKQNDLSNIDYPFQIGGCIKCNLRMICRGGCPMEGIWESGFPLRKSWYTCTVEHVFLPKLLLMMAEDPRIVQVVANDAQIVC